MKRVKKAETPTTAILERERKILLDLGNDITRVREKNDLLFLFKERIKELFYFTHTIVTLIDRKDETYTPFLLDNDGSPIRKHTRYGEMVAARFLLNEPFIQAVLQSEDPISFILEDVMNEPLSPPFLKVNYEGGVREILMTRLMKEGQPMGFIHIYSDRTDSFTPGFRSVMKGIAPQLSSAVSNIIKNEEVLNKEKEKSFLLAFSSALAGVRTKEELTGAVRIAIRSLDQKSGFVIRRINEDNTTMSAYVFDLGMRSHDENVVNALRKARYPINDGLQNRVLNSPIPLLFNVDREIQRGITSAYLQGWKVMGFKNFVGVRLRNGETNIGIIFLDIEEIKIELLQGICAQISIAVANIIANEQINKKQEEQAFLLEFSNDITQIRTKADLQEAIFRVLDKTLQTKLAMIRLLDDDGYMPAYMYDKTLFKGADDLFNKMSTQRISSKEGYSVRVLASNDGLMFNVDEELKSGNEYAKLWKASGMRNMYALPLRVGDKTIGTIWLLANQLSRLLLKGICAQISVAIANILANEKLLAYKKQLEVENDYLKEQIKTIYNFSEIIGSGERMQEVYRLIGLVAESNTTVLVLGETGTGKELIARAVHTASPRKDKLMVKVNCAALPANLIESELFGHEKGAFTGATDRRLGKFELADNSTLFLDEIGELPLEAQSKLLRIIQERELERLGGKHTIKVNVRLIAATNRNLEEEVKAGRFRADLYFRLNVFPIDLPPLRDRSEDIEALTHFFVQKYSRNTGRNIRKVSPKVIQQLRSYTWPGNVRELEHLIERSVLLATDDTLSDVYIPRQADTEKQDQAYLLNRSLEEVERSYIIETLKRCAGKISGSGSAAEILQVPGNTLHSKMKKLGISKSDYFA